MITRRPETRDYFRNEAFASHIATLQTARFDDGELITVLDWRNPKSGRHAMRFLFERHMLIVTGDIGNAVFALTQQAAPGKVAHYGIEYLHEKLACSSPVPCGVAFDAELAAEEIRERLGSDTEHKYAVTWLVEEAEDASSEQGWLDFLREANDIEDEWYEWLPGCGRVYDNLMEATLTGIQMAAKQLNII